MLPNGKLAKHGYSVDYGYGFVGTCMGSHQLPFEVSKDFISNMVSQMERQIAEFVPAVVPNIDMDLVRRSNRRPCDLTAEEKEQVGFRRIALDHNRQQVSRQQFVAYQTPRLNKWSAQPLKERAAEDSIADTKKAINKGIRLAARTRDEAKYQWNKACEKLTKLAGEYANRPFQASRDAAGNPNFDLYVDFPYTATNASAKITAMARQYCQNAPEIVAMADEVDSLLAAFKAAKDAHAAIKG